MCDGFCSMEESKKQTLTERANAVKRGFVELPKGTIHYRTAGSGPPLLLLHNATGSSAYFLDVLPLLAAKYKAMAMDIFGHGDSDPPPEGFRIEDAARTVINFLDALGVGRTHILGQHTGSGIAAEVAVSYPHRVDRLVLVGSPDWDEEARIEARRVVDPVVDLSMDGSHMLHVWREREGPATPLTSVETVHRATMTALQSLWWASEVHHWVEDQYLSERLPLVQSPTLLMAGEHDTMVGYIDRHRALLPQSRPGATAVIKGAGDYAAMEKPREWARLVLDFLEKPFPSPSSAG